MDVWVVAAAAGAGYVAQRLKNLARGRNNWSDLSSDNLNFDGPEIREKPQGKSCPFRRVLSAKSFGEAISTERERACQDASGAEMASAAFEDENLAMWDTFASCTAVSSSNSLAGILPNGNTQGDWKGAAPANESEFVMDDSLPLPSSGDMGFSYGFRRNSTLRSRRISTQLIKPRTPLESCLMAQLYNEHAEIEEYTYSPRPLHRPKMRPFLVTDGSRIISRAPHDLLSEQTGMMESMLSMDTYLQASKTVVGVPRLPNIVHLGKKAKAGNGKELDLRRDSSRMTNRNHNTAKSGSTDRALLFYLGLTMGIMSSFLVNEQEMEKLNKLLKQTENLVQDLQEELEMKDSLTVKELAVEDYGSQDVHNDCYFDDTVCALSLEQKLEESSRNRSKELCDQNAEEKSKIEAELQAELERLESNMNSSRLEGKFSNGVELDRDVVPDVAQGNLRADFFGATIGNQPYADRDGSSNSTPHSANYSLSPRELSLRLHEVIQSRLEERVKELEMALQNSQRKVKYIESEHMRPWRESSNHASPTTKDGQPSEDQPVVINLMGEALAAYNEAYEEFTKVSESDEEDVPFELENGCRIQNGGLNSHVNRYSLCDVNPETSLNQLKEERSYTVSDDILCSRDESEDEMERLLIRQIVEKAKQGSPAVLNAQRALLSTFDTGH